VERDVACPRLKPAPLNVVDPKILLTMIYLPLPLAVPSARQMAEIKEYERILKANKLDLRT
jgi:hypothetical protein